MAVLKKDLGDNNRRHLDRDEGEGLSDKTVEGAVEREEEEALDEEVDEDYEAPLEDDDFIADEDDEEDLPDEVLSPKEQDARSLAARRAIERRMEQKKLDEDLDYLDLEA